jgi:agmatinase
MSALLFFKPKSAAALGCRCLSAIPAPTSTVALLGVADDTQSSFMRGAAEAPPRLRDAFFSPSSNGYAEWMEIDAHACVTERDLEDLMPKLSAAGEDVTITSKVIGEAIEDIFQMGHKPLTMGGDHAITHSLIKGIAAAREKRRKEKNEAKKPLCIIQFDAHSDLYEDFEGNKKSHACPFTRIFEKKTKVADRLIQIGLRTLTKNCREQQKRFDVRSLEMKDYPTEKRLLATFLNLHVPKDADIYVSFDMDCLDPAFAPGVSHHEPGGMSVRQALDCIQSIPGGLNVIGADVVEYNPERDVNGMTAMVGAKIMKELVAKMHHNPVQPKNPWVLLRNLPRNSTEQDVMDFLGPTSLEAEDGGSQGHQRGVLRIKMKSGKGGKGKGGKGKGGKGGGGGGMEAAVEFDSKEAAESACFHRCYKPIDETNFVDVVMEPPARTR